MQLSPYLFFTTTCEQRSELHAQCGLGRIVGTETLRHGENGMPVRTEAMRGKIMHAKFEGAKTCSSSLRTTMMRSR